MGSRGQDQDDVAEMARPSLTTAEARVVTAGRGCVRRWRTSGAPWRCSLPGSADAHAARVWLPLGYNHWASFCAAEFGSSRAQAYRLLDVARSLTVIHEAVAAGTETSRTRDTAPAAAAAALDYGLSQRALIAVSSRTDTVAELITRRLTALADSGRQDLDEPTVRAVVRQAVRDVRPTPPPRHRHRHQPNRRRTRPPRPARAVVDDLAAINHAIGELMLEVAPPYLSDTDAAHVLAPLCEQIGEPLEHGLAARRYPLSGDRRALHGTVL
ncbi:hypothetical protein [Streptomyces sp. NPDC051776]|uniref:hypothetical protein n=1 Tax=Streptomyces sp. NPDC051776 TaxID=3155414 RepID=UPI00343685A0